MRSRKGNKVYIENKTENQVLGVVNGEVKLVDDPRGHAWEKGEANKQGYFTFTNPASQKALTTNSEGFLTLEGKSEKKIICSANFCLLISLSMSYQQIETHVAFGDCLSL